MILNASYNSHRISEEGKLDPTQSKMADEFDVDDLLEAPYKKPEDTEVGSQYFVLWIFSVILVDWRWFKPSIIIIFDRLNVKSSSFQWLIVVKQDEVLTFNKKDFAWKENNRLL